ncbi:tetratricopeptide repeat protein [Candidatus Pelagibacter sp.]|nr:tetratricopeptide repeat protein [Candidatus Pelagibacter sp.]
MNKELSSVLELLKSKKFMQAEKKCSLLISKVNPNYDLHNIYAVILFQLKRYDDAISQWQKAIKLKPDYHFGYNNLGNAFLLKNDLNQALLNYEEAIKINPNYFEAIYNKANIFLKLKDFSNALKYYDKVLSLKNDYFSAHQGKAIVYKKIEKFDEAINQWEKVISLTPDNENAYVQKGDILFDKNMLKDALNDYEKAYSINPNKPFLLGSIIYTKTRMCEWEGLDKIITEFKSKIEKNTKVSPPYTALTIFDDPSIHLKVSKIWSNEHKKIDANKIEKIEKKSKKIKVGYFSADFRTHAMGHLMVKMLELHNREDFEIYGFYFGPKIKVSDFLAKRIQNSFDKFFDITLKDDLEVANLSKELGLDIAIDFMCFTGNQNRFGIFTQRCAPIQINFLGYPGTSGSKFLDYIILDDKLICEDNKKFFSESLIVLPDTYQPNEDKKEIDNKVLTKHELGLPKSNFVFSCFNSHQKIMPNIFEVWMNILKKKNDSVLWLLKDNDISEKNLKMQAENNNVNPERLIFADHLPLDQHLSRLRLADLVLDTFPYNAHTTCSDSLRMGVPVLTLKGKSFASRVATSLLTSMSLSELVTEKLNDYEEMALKISNNPEMLDQLKDKILRNRENSNVFKPQIFTNNIEKSYKKVYKNFIDGFSPQDFKL